MLKLYPWLSILMALALALFEWAFYFQRGQWRGPFRAVCTRPAGFQSGVDYARLPLVSASDDSTRCRGAGPFHQRAGRDGLHGSAWGLIGCDIRKTDLFGGYMFNIALSRRTMDVGPAI